MINFLTLLEYLSYDIFYDLFANIQAIRFFTALLYRLMSQEHSIYFSFKEISD